MTSELVLHQLAADRRARLMRTGVRSRSVSSWWSRRQALAAACESGAGATLSTVVRPGSQPQASTLGQLVAERGIAANEIAVQQLLRTIDRAGAHSIHVDIVADRSLFDAMRERALGHLLVRLADDIPAQRPDHAAA